MEIKTVAILGAGAIGSYFIQGLRGKLGKNLCVVAEGERKERLEKEGLIINGQPVSLNVKTPQEAKGIDLLIITVKYAALPSILSIVETVIDEHTLVLSPLNGIDSEIIIAKKIGSKNIVGSLMKIAVQRRGNVVTYMPNSGFGVIFGEKDGSLTDRITSLDKLFTGADMRHRISKNIIQDKWIKYALNVSKNLPQAIINVGFSAYAGSEHLAYISKKMRDEVVAVATAKGIDISDETNPLGINNCKPNARFSTLQDLDAKRTTEIEMFSGALIRMGKELNIPTPFNEFAYHAIKALEEKNAGLIS